MKLVMLKRSTIIFCLWLIVQIMHSHAILADSVGGEFTFLTSHIMSQRDAPVELYERRLDDRGQHVITPGLEFYWDQQLAKPVGNIKEIRISVGCLSDSITHLFCFMAVMSRIILYQLDRFQTSLHLGPGLIFRESWSTVQGYNPDNPMEESDYFLPGYEYKFMPLGEIDLLFEFTPGFQGVWSIVPGLPYVIVQSVGLRWTY